MKRDRKLKTLIAMFLVSFLLNIGIASGFQKSSESLKSSELSKLNENENEVLQCIKKLAEKSDPVEFVNEILNWNTEHPNPVCATKPHAEYKKSIHWIDHIYPQLFTKKLRALYLIERECTIKTKEICCGGDADPILHVQDVPKKWIISNKRDLGKNYQVDVNFNDVTNKPVRIFLTKEEEGWKIEDACSEFDNTKDCTLSSLTECKKENLQAIEKAEKKPSKSQD